MAKPLRSVYATPPASSATELLLQAAKFMLLVIPWRLIYATSFRSNLQRYHCKSFKITPART